MPHGTEELVWIVACVLGALLVGISGFFGKNVLDKMDKIQTTLSVMSVGMAKLEEQNISLFKTVDRHEQDLAASRRGRVHA